MRSAPGIALGLILIVTACGDDDTADTADTATSAAGTPATSTDATTGADGDQCAATVAGSELTFGVFAPVAQIDPTLVNGGLVGGHEIAAVYDVLMRFDFDANEYVPHLARSLTSNDDATVWTLTLRKDVEFDDGTALTAQVLADNFDRFFADGVINSSGGYLTSITEKAVVDEHTLRLTLDRPWADFPMVLADEPGMIVNPNAVGADRDAFAADPPPAAGIGPYVVERNAPNEELVLKARDNYWGGPVCVETLRFVFVPGDEATYDSFTNEELDVAFLRLPPVVQRARDDGADGFVVHVDSGRTLAINHAPGRPGNDPRIREAIALALDPDVLNERVYQGAGNVATSLIAEGSRFHSDAIESVTADPERAAALVEEAKADGFDGELGVLCATSPPAPDIALTTEGLLEAVGFDVETAVIPIGDQLGQVVTGDYDTACWGVSADAANASETMVRNFRSGSAGNRVGYASEAMDAALDAMLAATTPEEQQATMAAVNNIYVDDHVMATIAAIDEGVVWQPNVEGIVPTVGSVMLFHDAHLTD